MKNLSMTSLFEGNGQGKMFSDNLEKIENGDYRCAGKHALELGCMTKVRKD